VAPGWADPEDNEFCLIFGVKEQLGGPAMEHDEAIRILRSITEAFDAHDLDGIMSHFADDAVFDAPRGPDPWGRRYVGETRFGSLHWSFLLASPMSATQQDDHFVDGDWAHRTGRWSGTTTAGQAIEVRGCDLLDDPRPARSPRRTRSGRSARPD